MEEVPWRGCDSRPRRRSLRRRYGCWAWRWAQRRWAARRRRSRPRPSDGLGGGGQRDGGQRRGVGGGQSGGVGGGESGEMGASSLGAPAAGGTAGDVAHRPQRPTSGRLVRHVTQRVRRVRLAALRHHRLAPYDHTRRKSGSLNATPGGSWSVPRRVRGTDHEPNARAEQRCRARRGAVARVGTPSIWPAVRLGRVPAPQGASSPARDAPGSWYGPRTSCGPPTACSTAARGSRGSPMPSTVCQLAATAVSADQNETPAVAAAARAIRSLV